MKELRNVTVSLQFTGNTSVKGRSVRKVHFRGFHNIPPSRDLSQQVNRK